MKTFASKIHRGDLVTYCGASFVASSVEKDAVSGLLKVSVAGQIPQYIAPEREVEVQRVAQQEKPYVVLTRDYDAEGNKDVRRFTFRTAKQQSAFIRRTNRCVTFTN